MEKRNYTITLKNKTSSGGGNSPIAGSSKAKSDTEEREGILSKEGAKAFGSAMVAYHQVKSFATQIINHEVSKVELRTGSREMQQRANFINSTVQQGIGILESMATGALVGGLPGAIIGTALGTAHTLISYAQRQDTINTQRTLENRSIAMNFIRAGANGSRSQ